MDTESLYLFRDLCRTRNMTQTAKNFFLTQSTLSKRLARLEEELGVPAAAEKQGETGSGTHRQRRTVPGSGRPHAGIV